MAIERAVEQHSKNSPRPLSGRRIVVTRADSQAGSLARRIEGLGGKIFSFPTIEIRPPDSYAALDAAIKKIKNYDWMIFTSVNGVEQFLLRLKSFKNAMSLAPGLQIAAIGPETAKKLAAAGIQPHLVPKQYQAEGILDGLEPKTMRGKRVLIPRAAKARDILPETLRRWGAKVDVVEAYRTVVPRADVSGLINLLQKHKVEMITFTSSSTVANFVELLGGRDLSEIAPGAALACIGPITKKTVEDFGGHADVVAEEFTIPGLVRAIVDYFESSDRGTKKSF